MITINKEKCNNCSICSKICVSGVITAFKTTGTTPDNCINCGQCEAYCPKGAITIEYDGAAPYTGNVDVKAITPEQIGFHMANRRSVRNFKKSPVEKKKIEELMEIVRFAHTGANSQTLNWIIIHNYDALKKILSIAIEWIKVQVAANPDSPMNQILSIAVSEWENKRDFICRNAPHLAVAYGPSDGMIITTDTAIATTYFELAAPTFGIGTCWGGFFYLIASRSKELRQELGIPENSNIFGAVMFGYPEYKQYKLPKRNTSKVTWL